MQEPQEQAEHVGDVKAQSPDAHTPAMVRARFDKQRRRDFLLNRSLIAVILGSAVLSFALPLMGLSGVLNVLAVVPPLVLIAAMLWLTHSTSRVAKSLPLLGVLIERDPMAAEAEIDLSLSKYPVMRWARLLTYQRLATLRHRQRRFAEAAEIAFAILSEPMPGPAAAARPHLLLMLAEAKLEVGDLPGAYHALDSLYRTRLSLIEALQRLALQTRYELQVGYYQTVLRAGREKIELAELMPPAQCGAMHAMLAFAAKHADQPRIADWLAERAKLITPPKLLEQFERGAFSIGVVQDNAAE